MRVLGVDIGTTSISAVALDTESAEALDCVSVPNPASYPGEYADEHLQSPERILACVQALIDRVRDQHGELGAIGLDGQMHGMLYVDRRGKAISPLYTWQDGRGDRVFGDETAAQRLSRLTGYPMASGYGLTTHYVHRLSGSVPDYAAKICTIADYAAMALTGRTTPVCHASNAASMGLFDAERGAWNTQAAACAGISPAILPEVTARCCVLGEDACGTPVACAIGDNQASFIGAVSDPEHSVLVNVGTGAQVSMAGAAGMQMKECEVRPLDGEKMLLAGASLCGGRAYAMLRSFFEDCARMAGYSVGVSYEQMNLAAMSAMEDDPLCVDTRFCGSRANPLGRGGIAHIGEKNFDAAHLAAGMLNGMADELHAYYEEMIDAGVKPANVMIASGNGVRRNPALRLALRKRFGLELYMPVHAEEAAYGAALSAVQAVCGGEEYARKRGIIRYTRE